MFQTRLAWYNSCMFDAGEIVRICAAEGDAAGVARGVMEWPECLAALVSMQQAARGRRGGTARTDAKVAAVRENGKRGGRPRKEPADADNG